MMEIAPQVDAMLGGVVKGIVEDIGLWGAAGLGVPSYLMLQGLKKIPGKLGENIQALSEYHPTKVNIINRIERDLEEWNKRGYPIGPQGLSGTASTDIPVALLPETYLTMATMSAPGLAKGMAGKIKNIDVLEVPEYGIRLEGKAAMKGFREYLEGGGGKEMRAAGELYGPTGQPTIIKSKTDLSSYLNALSRKHPVVEKALEFTREKFNYPKSKYIAEGWFRKGSRHTGDIHPDVVEVVTDPFGNPIAESVAQPYAKGYYTTEKPTGKLIGHEAGIGGHKPAVWHPQVKAAQQEIAGRVPTEDLIAAYTEYPTGIGYKPETVLDKADIFMTKGGAIDIAKTGKNLSIYPKVRMFEELAAHYHYDPAVRAKMSMYHPEVARGLKAFDHLIFGGKAPIGGKVYGPYELLEKYYPTRMYGSFSDIIAREGMIK